MSPSTKSFTGYKCRQSLPIKFTTGWLVNAQILYSRENYKKEYNDARDCMGLPFTQESLASINKEFPWIMWWGKCGNNVGYCVNPTSDLVVIDVDSSLPFASFWIEGRLKDTITTVTNFNKGIVSKSFLTSDEFGEKYRVYFSNDASVKKLYNIADTITEEKMETALICIILIAFDQL